MGFTGVGLGLPKYWIFLLKESLSFPGSP